MLIFGLAYSSIENVEDKFPPKRRLNLNEVYGIIYSYHKIITAVRTSKFIKGEAITFCWGSDWVVSK
jgi:hypothetical protein